MTLLFKSHDIFLELWNASKIIFMTHVIDSLSLWSLNISIPRGSMYTAYLFFWILKYFKLYYCTQKRERIQEEQKISNGMFLFVEESGQSSIKTSLKRIIEHVQQDVIEGYNMSSKYYVQVVSLYLFTSLLCKFTTCI